MKRLLKAFVVLASESIWAYYVITLFMRLEYNQFFFVDPTWWLIAGVLGFTLNRLLLGRIHYVLLFAINGVVFIVILWRHWLVSVPEGIILFGIFLSFMIAFVYGRSISFLFKMPTRKNILYRFEGNVIFYTVLLFLYVIKGWDQASFHASFLFVIFASLFLLLFTLEDQETSKKEVAIQRVGQAGILPGVMGLLFLLVLAISSTLFLPAFRSGIQSIVHTSFSSLVWLYGKLTQFLQWLSTKIEPSEVDDYEQSMGEVDQLPASLKEEPLFEVNIEGFLLLFGIVAIVIISFIFIRLLKQWRMPMNTSEKKRKSFNFSLFRNNWHQIRSGIQRLSLWWRKKFPHYYKEPIYWDIAQLERFGRKVGIKRKQTETQEEYIVRMIHSIKKREDEKVQEESTELIAQLKRLNRHFQETYYGRHHPKGDSFNRDLPSRLKKYWQATRE